MAVQVCTRSPTEYREREIPMSFIVWMAVLGAVLLLLALTSSYLRWMPVTKSGAWPVAWQDW